MDFSGYCVKCGKCKAVCPTYSLEKEEHLSPRGRVHLVQKFFNGVLSPLDVEVSVESCLLCMACEQVCPQNVPITSMLKQARVRITPASKKYKEVFLGVSQGLGLPFSDYLTSSNKECAIFVGCLFARLYPALVEKLATFLNALGYSVHIPKEQVCCGFPYEASGDETKARRCELTNEKVFSRFDTIVTGCATCASHLKRTGIGESVKDVMELLSLYADILRVRNTFENAKIVYHVPCHLIRGQGIEPVLPDGVKPLSLVCCGFGSSNICLAQKRIEEALAKKADLLVTSCPACMLHLKKAAISMRAPIGIYHLLDVFTI